MGAARRVRPRNRLRHPVTRPDVPFHHRGCGCGCRYSAGRSTRPPAAPVASRPGRCGFPRPMPACRRSMRPCPPWRPVRHRRCRANVVATGRAVLLARTDEDRSRGPAPARTRSSTTMPALGAGRPYGADRRSAIAQVPHPAPRTARHDPAAPPNRTRSGQCCDCLLVRPSAARVSLVTPLEVWGSVFPPRPNQSIKNRIPREICVSTVFSDMPIRAAIARCGRPSTRRKMKASRVLSGMAAIAQASWRNSSRSIAVCSGDAASSGWSRWSRLSTA